MSLATVKVDYNIALKAANGEVEGLKASNSLKVLSCPDNVY